MADDLKRLVGRKMSKQVKFMGEDVKIHKMSVAEVMDVQARVREMESGGEDKGLEVLRTVIRASVEGAKDLSDEDFSAFPLDELTKLSSEIMKHSGIAQDQGK